MDTIDAIDAIDTTDTRAKGVDVSEDPGAAAVKDATAPEPEDPRKPASPPQVSRPGWRYTAKAAWSEFNRDQATDLAAALTYYSVLSIFPALLALVSLLGVFGEGESTTNALLDLVRQLGQGDVADQLAGPVRAMVESPAAGVTLVVGVAGALWSASGYVGGFGRAMNRIYEVDEGRGMVRLRLQQLGLTAALVVMAALVLLGLVVSGPVARAVGSVVGLGDAAVSVWGWAKWPVMLLLVVLMVAVLYYATPNVRQPRLRWVSVGAGVAITIWVLASVGFGFYVGNFGSYNKTYGSLGGVVVFLLWLWLTNVALLFGAEVDAELERVRQLQGGIEAERTIQLPPKASEGSRKAAQAHEEKVARGRELRLRSSGGRDRDAGAGRERASRLADALEPLPSERARARGLDRR